LSTKVEVLFPTGRIVQGDLYKFQDKDADGKPLTIKSGPNAGQPTVKYFFSVAIPKTPGNAHWGHEEWGAKIWAAGHAAMPVQSGLSTFAWKVENGDDATPNKKGRPNVSREGFPGCWVVNFSSQFAPKIYNSDCTAPMPEPGAVQPGDFVQVLGTVDGNNSALNPGVFINHAAVAFQGYGPRISSGPDLSKYAFGKGPLPPGASAAPIGGMTAAPVAPLAAPAAPLAPAPAPAPVAPTAVAPAPSFVGVAAAPPPPAAAPALHKGIPVASYLASGWTVEQLKADGYTG
jgi:hypothetical protein